MVYLNVAADQSVLLLLLAALFVRVLFCLFKFFPLQNWQETHKKIHTSACQKLSLVKMLHIHGKKQTNNVWKFTQLKDKDRRREELVDF